MLQQLLSVIERIFQRVPCPPHNAQQILLVAGSDWPTLGFNDDALRERARLTGKALSAHLYDIGLRHPRNPPRLMHISETRALVLDVYAEPGHIQLVMNESLLYFGF